PLEAQPLGIVNLPDRPVVQQFHGAPLVRYGAALHPDLHHAVVLAGRLHHLLTLKYVVAGGLLHIDVFARLAGPDGRQRMPMVRRRDGARVDILVFVQLPQVLIDLGLVRLGLDHDLLVALGRSGVDVAQRPDVSVGNAQIFPDVTRAAPAHADHRHVDFVVGAHHRQGHRAANQKSSTFHHFSPSISNHKPAPGAYGAATRALASRIQVSSTYLSLSRRHAPGSTAFRSSRAGTGIPVSSALAPPSRCSVAYNLSISAWCACAHSLMC